MRLLNFRKFGHFGKLILVAFLCENIAMSACELNKSEEMYEKVNKVVSRKKRFITFPEASTFQLVFCNTFPTIFNIGGIFLFGYTAALAWELPQDPYSPFRHKADPLHRRIDSPQVKYIDQQGKVLFQLPYNRKQIVNPAFAKRSVDAHQLNTGDVEKEKNKINRKQMHAGQHKREFLKSEHMEQSSVEFHRTNRASLYEKLEKMLQAMGMNGRQCLLKTLCEVGKNPDREQNHFAHEILTALFTLPQGTDFEEEYHREYDRAHTAAGSCEHLYPECTDSLYGNEPTLES